MSSSVSFWEALPYVAQVTQFQFFFLSCGKDMNMWAVSKKSTCDRVFSVHFRPHSFVKNKSDRNRIFAIVSVISVERSDIPCHCKLHEIENLTILQINDEKCTCKGLSVLPTEYSTWYFKYKTRNTARQWHALTRETIAGQWKYSDVRRVGFCPNDLWPPKSYQFILEAKCKFVPNLRQKSLFAFLSIVLIQIEVTVTLVWPTGCALQV